MDTNIVVAILIVVLLAVAGWLLLRKKQSDHLARKYGPEYGRTVETLGSRDKAEADLRAREKRMQKLHIVPLVPAEAERFAQAWRAAQARFVDDPKGVVREADQLVAELMQKRGYPMGDFDQCAADISVDHPAVVEHYRAGHAIAVRDARGEADTEALRQAFVHYRALFADLLEVRAEPTPEQLQRQSQTPASKRSSWWRHASAADAPRVDRDKPNRNS